MPVRFRHRDVAAKLIKYVNFYPYLRIYVRRHFPFFPLLSTKYSAVEAGRKVTVFGYRLNSYSNWLGEGRIPGISIVTILLFPLVHFAERQQLTIIGFALPVARTVIIGLRDLNSTVLVTVRLKIGRKEKTRSSTNLLETGLSQLGKLFI